MHSRIFALNTEKCESEYFDLPSYFVPEYADYTLEAEDGQRSIDWLTGYMDHYGIAYTRAGSEIVFHGMGTYWDAMYEKYLSAIAELSQVTKEKFCIDTVSTFALEVANGDECGFCFLLEDEYVLTMQDFLRQVRLEVPYYIGKIYDYHF